MLKVSVIVPVYNVEKYLPDSLDSLCNQTLKDIEIICVNDGSTDGSLNILSEYLNLDSRIKVIDKVNEGAAAARNAGMETAAGEYIGFVDSDDWVDADFYEKLYLEASSKNADIARAPYKYSYKNYEKEEENLSPILKKRFNNNEELNVNEHSVVIWNAIYRKEFLKNCNIMFFDELPCVNDVSFTARVTFHSRRTVPVIGTYYHYRQNVSNQLTTLSLKRVNNVIEANKITIDFLNSVESSKYDYINAYARCIWRYDDVFKQALCIDVFDEKEQNRFLNSFIEAINNFKYDYKLLIDSTSVYLLKNYKFKTYLDFCKGRIVPQYYLFKVLSKITFGEYRKLYKTLYKSMKRYYKKKRG